MARLAREASPRTRFRQVLRALLITALAVVLAAGGFVAWAYLTARASLPQLEGTAQVPGLSAAVTVIRDSRGVPHVYAATVEDLLFAQGYVTAQDRLWQMDMARRYAAGELAEVLGSDLVRQDREQRILRLGAVAEGAAAALSPDERAYLDAYVRGVNAYISAHRDRLPPEFRLLRYQPRPWTPADAFLIGASMSQLLNHGQYRTEWVREKIQAKLGEQLTSALYPSSSRQDQPPGPTVKPIAGWGPADAAACLNEPWISPSLPAEVEAELVPGSNNWVVSGARTPSGKPLLANDMHLPHRIPNIWYQVHLEAGDFRVAGVSIPGIPFVIVGHNQRIAWGFTNLGPDVQDLFVETFNEKGEYRTPEGWQQPERYREVIRVKGRPDEVLEVVVTRHGPIVTDLLPGETRKLALRWTLYDAGTMLMPFFEVNRARNWEEFRSAFARFGTPSQNVVYADVEGHIGYQATGRIPVRRSGDGALPVEGSSGNHDWTGFVPFDELPRVFDPPSGLLATANGRIVPDEYKHHLGYQWGEPARTNRIYELLQSGKKFTATDMLAMQVDVRSEWDRRWAQRYAAAVRGAKNPSARARTAAEILGGWDGVVAAAAAAPTLVSVANRNLRRLLLEPILGESWREYRWYGSGTALEGIVETGDRRWLADRYASFDELLVAALEAALSSPEAPAELRSWRWGQHSPVQIQHPVFGAIPGVQRWTGTGSHPQSGNGNTVKQVGRTFGPSQRMVVDFADPDRSLANLVTGQSGHVLSPHYMDHWPGWLRGYSFELPFSRPAVEAAARHRLTLEPAD